MVIRLIAPALLGVVGLFAGGCKNLDLDVDRVDTLSCEGETCECSGNLCTCGAGDCGFECPGDCQITCSQSDTCEIDVAGALSLTCVRGSTCEAIGGDMSEVTCERDGICHVEVGAESRVVCNHSANGICDFTVGAASQVRCQSTEVCPVTCKGPECWMSCTGIGTCAVTCAETGQPAMACINGTFACGATCPDF